MKRWTCTLCHHADVPHKRRDICDDCQESLDVRGLAWCTLGRHRVEADEMEAGRATHCRACRRQAQRQRYELGDKVVYAKEWRERRAEQYRAYRERNREQRQAYDRAYYAKHSERIKARARVYYYRHRTHYIALNRQWRAANPDRVAAIARRQKVRAKLRILHSWKQAVESQSRKRGDAA